MNPMIDRRHLLGLIAGIGLAVTSTAALAQDKFIVVASTTSTEQSGLFGHILPIFTKKTGIQVRVVAQGTGQALKTGEQGNADVVFVPDVGDAGVVEGPHDVARVVGGRVVEHDHVEADAALREHRRQRDAQELRPVARQQGDGYFWFVHRLPPPTSRNSCTTICSSSAMRTEVLSRWRAKFR